MCGRTEKITPKGFKVEVQEFADSFGVFFAGIHVGSARKKAGANGESARKALENADETIELFLKELKAQGK